MEMEEQEQHSKPQLLERNTTTNQPLTLTTKAEGCSEMQEFSLLSKGAVKDKDKDKETL